MYIYNNITHVSRCCSSFFYFSLSFVLLFPIFLFFSVLGRYTELFIVKLIVYTTRIKKIKLVLLYSNDVTLLAANSCHGPIF